MRGLQIGNRTIIPEGWSLGAAIGNVIKMAGQWRPQTINDLDNQILGYSGTGTLSGVRIDEAAAMRISAVYNAVMQISNTVGGLPLPTYIRTGKETKRHYIELPLYNVLLHRTGPQDTAYNTRRIMQYHAIIYGMGYSWKIRDGSNRVVGLQLMNPTTTRVVRNEVTKLKEYEYKDPKTGITKRIPWDKIFSIAGLGFDGLNGVGVVKLACESLGLSKAYEEFSSRFVGQGAHLGGIMQLKEGKKLSVEAHSRFKEELTKKYSGLWNSQKMMILEDGSEFKPLGMPLVDAEILASRNFQIQEIARWLNIPPHKLKDLSRATYSNIESEQRSFLNDTIMPWVDEWESEISLQLINPLQINKVFSEHSFDQLLRADIKTRHDVYRTATNSGIMTRNEARTRENMNASTDKNMDAFTIQKQMVNIEDMGAEESGNNNNDSAT